MKLLSILKYTLSIITLLVSISACTRNQADKVSDKKHDIDAIHALLEEHVKAVNTSNTALNLSGFTDDVIYMPPQSTVVKGIDELTKLVESAYKSLDAEIEMTAEETVVSGNWAFQWGNIDGYITPLEGGDTTILDSKYMYIYHKQTDGTWKIARDIYNSNLPLQ